MVVPQNMPGAGGRRAANWLYAVAPKKGTVFACFGHATDQALGPAGIRFDAGKFNWVGNLVAVNMLASVASRVMTVDEAKKKTPSIGTKAAGNGRWDRPPSDRVLMMLRQAAAFKGAKKTAP